MVQARPETVQSRRPKATMRTWRLAETGALLVSGRSIGESIGAGKARVILEAQHISEFKNGEVLVTDKTDPDWEPIMKKAAAVVTNQGGRTCHAAIIARELGIPAIVGTLTGTAAIRTGEDVTVCCAEGEEGHVYEMAKHGLKRGINGLEAYVMCEIPAHVILAEEFSRVFDGFSIGSNDLTQLTLGLDRDSPLVSRQAPGDYPEFARFLVENGIDSISLNPDSVLKMRAVVAEAERATTAPRNHA